MLRVDGRAARVEESGSGSHSGSGDGGSARVIAGQVMGKKPALGIFWRWSHKYLSTASDDRGERGQEWLQGFWPEELNW